MELISQLRQMMAEQRFFEVQKLLELRLLIQDESNRHEMLSIFSEALEAQGKVFPRALIIELCELESAQNKHDDVLARLNKITKQDERSYFLNIHKLKISAAEYKGQTNELYILTTKILLHQFAHQAPFIPSWLTTIIEKYFKNDFAVKLQLLCISLMKEDIKSSEGLLKELILSCVEKSSPKGTAEKFRSIYDILKIFPAKGKLEIYQNFALLSSDGPQSKSDFKKLVEMVIYFEDFKLQALLLNLFDKLNLSSEASNYSFSVKQNPNYNFVYFDKFYSHLKKYFVDLKSTNQKTLQKYESPNLVLEDDYSADIFSSDLIGNGIEEDQKFFHLLKHQNYSTDQLCDLAVSFLQAEMPQVALRAANMAIDSSLNDEDYLKASYLKITSLLHLKDYRSALDASLESIARAKSLNDILSFLYTQAEVYIRLEELEQAKRILAKILTMDSKYRLAKERLDKLNEI